MQGKLARIRDAKILEVLCSEPEAYIMTYYEVQHNFNTLDIMFSERHLKI